MGSIPKTPPTPLPGVVPSFSRTKDSPAELWGIPGYSWIWDEQEEPQLKREQPQCSFIHSLGAPGWRIHPKTHFIKHQAGYFCREMTKNVHPDGQNKSEVMNSHSWSSNSLPGFPHSLIPVTPSHSQGICSPSWSSGKSWSCAEFPFPPALPLNKWIFTFFLGIFKPLEHNRPFPELFCKTQGFESTVNTFWKKRQNCC